MFQKVFFLFNRRWQITRHQAWPKPKWRSWSKSCQCDENRNLRRKFSKYSRGNPTRQQWQVTKICKQYKHIYLLFCLISTYFVKHLGLFPPFKCTCLALYEHLWCTWPGHLFLPPPLSVCCDCRMLWTNMKHISDKLTGWARPPFFLTTTTTRMVNFGGAVRSVGSACRSLLKSITEL